MQISLTELLVWLLISLIVGALAELIARRSLADGFLGAVIFGFIAIFLVNNLLHFHIDGEPYLFGVPLISSIIAATILVAIWSAFGYRRFSRFRGRRRGREYESERPRRRYRRRREYRD